MPFFSVIIPSYNRANYIRGTLDSLRAQEFTDYETIVVDDGSTDDTMSILRETRWVRVLRENNKGPGAARNLGVSQATGEYVAFLDSDDVWFPWSLKTFASVIEQHNQPALIAAKLVEFWNEGELDTIREEPLTVDVFEDYYSTSRMNYFVGACMMVLRRAVFEQSGGFNSAPVYAEDCDLALRLGLVDKFVQVLSPVTLGYRQHGTNARRDYRRIYRGTINLIESENGGRYPGGQARKSERIRLVTLHTRPFSVACIRNGNDQFAWRLYWKTFPWHLRLGRWKYLLGFPVLAAWYALLFKGMSKGSVS